MFRSLRGIITEKGKRTITIDVNGVGYGVFVTPRTLEESRLETTVRVLIHTTVRDDAIDLFGFLTEEERALFEHLITVSGIGGKTAMNVLAMAKAADILSAIRKGDATMLTAVSGIGRKTAERIIVELREKVGVGDDSTLSTTDAEVLDALAGLGYTAHEARMALRALGTADLDAPTKIKEALKRLGKK